MSDELRNNIANALDGQTIWADGGFEASIDEADRLAIADTVLAALPTTDQTWFTSDLHFNHEKLLRLGEGRPFDSVDEMNRALIDNWNAKVGDNDTVFVLGDVVMGVRAEGMALVQELNGHKVLIPGNHDHVHEMHGLEFNAKRMAAIDLYLSAFDSIFAEGQSFFVIRGRTFAMSHFPYDEDERHEGKYVQWQPEDQGLWLLHGHVHHSWKVKGKQINVGVDVWDYAPVSVQQIIDIAWADA